MSATDESAAGTAEGKGAQAKFQQSLFYKLFDTRAFVAMSHAVSFRTRKMPEAITLSDLQYHLRYVEDRSTLHDAGSKASLDNDVRRFESIWSFDASDEAPGMTDVRCRVRADGGRRNLVLESLRFGHDDGSSFRDEVRVWFTPGTDAVRLPMEDEFCVARFRLGLVATMADAHRLWPLSHVHDMDVLWVYLYDVELASGDVTPVPEDDPELQTFMEACRLVSEAQISEEPALPLLCKDKLWTTLDPTPAVATAPDAGAGSPVAVRAAVARIVVCCSVTLVKESDDFTPGKPVWSARMFPHIMAASTLPLAELACGIKFVRPEKRTSGKCGCEGAELNEEMSSVLVADVNADNRLFPNAPILDFPVPIWNSMFNYAVCDPFNNLVKETEVKVVDRSKDGKRTFEGAITRLGDPAGVVSRRYHQGVFDNIHVAPTMRVHDCTHVVNPRNPLASDDISADGREKWHLDEVYMAPICAHDCFHMHWRWSDDVKEPSAWGFSGTSSPHRAAGRPMVPTNQDVYLRMLGRAAFVYKVRAFNCEADDWIVVCHHGATYAIETKTPIEHSLKGVYADPRMDLVKFVEFSTNSGNRWASLYWNMRWHAYKKETHVLTNEYTVEERVSITDWQMLVNEAPSLASRR